MKNEVVVKMLFGSHMYGMANENSDKDYKTVVFPTVEEILMQRADYNVTQSTGSSHSRNGADDIDNETFSFMQFLKLAAKGETVALDMLHAPQSAILEENEFWKELVSKREMFYTKNMKAYIGYVRKQAAKYGVKGSRLAVLEDALNVAKSHAETQKVYKGIPIVSQIFDLLPQNEHAAIIEVDSENSGKQVFYEICGRKFQDTNRVDYFIQCLEKIYNAYGARAQAAKDNDGIDWKALHHALRAGYQARYIYTAGTFSYPLPEKDFLMDVKAGKLDYLTEVQPTLEALVDEVMVLAEESDYPDKVDMADIEGTILDVHAFILSEYFENE